MIYDKDLRKTRRQAGLLVVLNIAVALLNAWARNWLVAVAGALWALNCLLAVSFTESEQRTRDEDRVVQGWIHDLRERQEP